MRKPRKALLILFFAVVGLLWGAYFVQEICLSKLPDAVRRKVAREATKRREVRIRPLEMPSR